MDEREMFEKSFDRPKNFFCLPENEQWEIDKRLGILDWKGEGLSTDDFRRFLAHYDKTADDVILVKLED